MLEIIQVLMTSSYEEPKYPAPNLVRDIIFLFNGAEEVLLAASHGFITKVSKMNLIRSKIVEENLGFSKALLK